MPQYYILQDGKIKGASLLERGRWFETADRTIMYNKDEKVGISTVFLGLDHGFGGEKLLFESLVFHRKEDPNNDIGDEIDMERYGTIEEATAGHQRLCEKYLFSTNKDD